MNTALLDVLFWLAVGPLGILVAVLAYSFKPVGPFREMKDREIPRGWE